MREMTEERVYGMKKLYLTTDNETSMILYSQGGVETSENLYGEGGNREPIEPREISRQGNRLRYGWLLPEDLYYAEARKKGHFGLIRSFPLTKDTDEEFFLVERSGKGYEPHEDVALYRALPSIWEDRCMFAHEKTAWDAMAPDFHPAWEKYKVIFSTPFFERDGQGEEHRSTSYPEMMAFLTQKEKEYADMRLIPLFTSAIYGFTVPVAVFSKDLPAGKLSLEEAGAILQKTGKPVIHYQAQLHGNEVASGEAALSMVAYLGTEEGKKLLDKVHIYIIPCSSPEGALLYHRNTGAGVNLNRDFGALSAPETRGIVRAFRAFLPVAVIDGHEYRAKKMFRQGRYEDVQLSLGVASNEDRVLLEANETVLFDCVKSLSDMGLRSFFYRDHVSGREMVTATRYFAEQGAMTVLIESRGIDFGQERFHRRVMGQFTVARHFFEAIAERPEFFAENSRREREHFLSPFDRDFVLESRYTVPTEKDPHFPVYTFDFSTGALVKTEEKGVPSYKVPVRMRPRPLSYLIPKGKEWEKSVLDLLDRHSILYEEKEKGYQAILSGYEWKGESLFVTQEKEVTFPDGAYEISVCQPLSHIISMLFEPDCDDAVEAKEEFITQALFAPEGAGLIFRREQK